MYLATNRVILSPWQSIYHLLMFSAPTLLLKLKDSENVKKDFSYILNVLLLVTVGL